MKEVVILREIALKVYVYKFNFWFFFIKPIITSYASTSELQFGCCETFAG